MELCNGLAVVFSFGMGSGVTISVAVFFVTTTLMCVELVAEASACAEIIITSPTPLLLRLLSLLSWFGDGLGDGVGKGTVVGTFLIVVLVVVVSQQLVHTDNVIIIQTMRVKKNQHIDHRVTKSAFFTM